jgi:hypothetical protein
MMKVDKSTEAALVIGHLTRARFRKAPNQIGHLTQARFRRKSLYKVIMLTMV